MRDTTPLSWTEVIVAIQDSWEENTGERPSRKTADLILERMCEAFYHKFEGGGPAYAVAQDRTTARYLIGRYGWKGEDRRRLVDALEGNCWCSAPATYLVPVDPMISDANAVLSNGSPAIRVCDAHMDRDGYEPIAREAVLV